MCRGPRAILGCLTRVPQGLSMIHKIAVRLRNWKAASSVLVLLAIAAFLAWGRSSHTFPRFRRIAENRVDFSRDIRPIFNQNCVSCHGGVRQKNGVSFIFRDEALGKGKSGRQTIVPGDPDASELISRITAKDTDVRMPFHGPALPPEQIALLRRWIGEGARWSDYWAFVPPKAQPLPAVKHASWVRQPMMGSFWRAWNVSR